jgi:hypothetical protein
MKNPTFFTKIKLVFFTLVVILLSVPIVSLLLIVSMLLHSLDAFKCESFFETVRRGKILFLLFFYSTKIIFTKKRKDYAIVYCLIRKINKFKRK